MVSRRDRLAGLHLDDPTKVSLLQAQMDGHPGTARACIPSLASDDMSRLVSTSAASRSRRTASVWGRLIVHLAPEIRLARELRARIRAGRRRSISPGYLTRVSTSCVPLRHGPRCATLETRRFSAGGGMMLTVECEWQNQSHGVIGL
ncbi:hypothetical protein DTO006G1_5381 [Penicillium roqueforti]|uniref:uncharacterized protein n=1 Tax=Penicillium roqueforti TaxID=5082 RepID=UPI00190BC018|nr:uncharacterized protein LCP9604111_3295 [Penicillium roqueforti]KAF9250393.1 hypothetical protein LCP9604111_3295 [Penicillium roqueforti]KAI1833080.1 hypothetical protein CBS147337_6037 [Penicillium roqueforti]KAI2682658.1 hypothetical protein LCP963914a_6149 [Penicillium roqueforti]KAI2701386.1 hypothetical protein CBS147354_9764 [Penicillium roqueforti]KAI2703425.1 hypothetical protein CBS147372_3740 [Penicillium roqueforti]